MVLNLNNVKGVINPGILANQESSGGFTLIEVMIAMAIFVIGILGVFSMQTTAIKQNTASRMQTEATSIGVQHMELLMALPYDNVQLSAAAEDNPHQQQLGGFTVQWTVTTPALADPDYGGLPVKLVDLEVSGANPNARPVKISFIRGQRM